jgi:hypothetical protein
MRKFLCVKILQKLFENPLNQIGHAQIHFEGGNGTQRQYIGKKSLYKLYPRMIRSRARLSRYYLLESSVN